jgi:ribosomal protein S18 acetylase RimI-like enzyme
MSDVRIVAATAKDIPVILNMIRGLADYERMSDRFAATDNALREHLFGARPAAEVILIHFGEKAVGFALFFSTFSTFACRPGIYLEDLFIEPEWRGRGFGRRLLEHLAALGVERGCDRLQWVVLPWNERAIEFYRRLGAEKVSEWDTFRLVGDAFDRLARGRS